jgi:hypothetical protein
LLVTLRFATFFAGLRAEAFFAAAFFGADFFGADFALFFFLLAARDFVKPLFLLVFLDFFAVFAMIVLPILSNESLDSTIRACVNSKMKKRARSYEISHRCVC